MIFFGVHVLKHHKFEIIKNQNILIPSVGFEPTTLKTQLSFSKSFWIGSIAIIYACKGVITMERNLSKRKIPETLLMNSSDILYVQYSI